HNHRAAWRRGRGTPARRLRAPAARDSATLAKKGGTEAPEDRTGLIRPIALRGRSIDRRALPRGGCPAVGVDRRGFVGTDPRLELPSCPVVGDVRTESLAEADVPQIYLSLYQTFSHHLAIFVRGQLNPAVIAKGVREQVQVVDQDL